MELSAAPGGAYVDTKGNPFGVILRLALPTMLAMLSQSVVNEVDIVFFAQLPCPESSNGQAALAPSLIALWAFGGSLSAISVGTQALTARRFAEGKDRDAGAVLTNALTFGLLASIVFTAIGFVCISPLMHVMVKNEAARELAIAYTRYRFLGISSMVLTFAFKSFFDGLGRTHIHMIASLVMNVANVALCYAFIFGHMGAPRMGPPGAAFAALSATWIGLFVMVVYALRSDCRTRFAWIDRKKISGTIMWQILRLAVPSGVATIAVMTGFAFFLYVVGRLDQIHGAVIAAGACGAAEAVNGAATTTIIGILKLTFTSCLAFGTATATLVSQSLGEQNPQKATRFGWASVQLGILIFGVVGLLEGGIFTKQILSFVSNSEAVRAAALVPFRLVGAVTPLIAVGMILTQALFGAGNARFVMVAELVLHFVCLIPLAWLFGIVFDWGLTGIWLSALVYVFALAGLMVWKFASGDWKRIRI